MNHFCSDILAQVSDAVLILDDAQRISYLNAAAERQYGVTATEALGLPLGELCQCRWASQEDQVFQPTAWPPQREWRGEVVHITRDGRELCIEASLTLLTEADGQPGGILAIFRDITERQRINAAAERENEQRMRLATEATGVGIWEWNVITNQIRWDAQMFRLYGLTPTTDGFIPYSAWSGCVLPEDLPRQEAILQATARQGGQSAREFRIRRSEDGECRCIQAVETVRTNAQGQIEWVVGTNLDVTERRLVETDLRQNREDLARAQAVGQLGSWRLDIKQNILTWSDENHRIFDIPEGTSLTYESFLEAIHPEDRAYVDAQWNAALRGDPYDIEHRIVVNGRVKWVREKAYLEFDASGELQGGFGITQDITGRKLAVIALREGDRRKDEFLAMLAHELRNPLAPIRNAVQILRLAAPKEPTLTRVSGMIERQVNQLVRLVDDLLDVSRVSRGKIQLQKTLLDLTAVIRQAIETTQPLIDTRRHTLNVALPPQTLRVEGDFARLAQVVSNLLNNAAKYTDEGGTIWLSVEPSDASHEVLIRVRDTGQGIDPAALGNLFELFYQADRNLDRSDGGLGIGLSLVKSLVEMHGGHVEAHSAGRGKGSEFVIRLPAYP